MIRSWDIPRRELDMRAVAILDGWFPATDEECATVRRVEAARQRVALGYPPPPPAPTRPLAPDVLKR